MRLPGKNVKPLRGIPLYRWTLDFAKSVNEFDQVVISTDIDEIHANANCVCIDRPRELAGADVSSEEVLIHVLDEMQARFQSQYKTIALLQPTSPFRSMISLRKGLELFDAHNLETVISVSELDDCGGWYLNSDNLLFQQASIDHNCETRVRVKPNGNFYLISVDSLLRERRIFSKEHIRGILLNDPIESLDIDTEEDWKLATAWCSQSLRL